MEMHSESQIYNDSAEAKIPAVLDYLSNVIEVFFSDLLVKFKN